jgi:hypothetical protein
MALFGADLAAARRNLAGDAQQALLSTCLTANSEEIR